MIATKIISYVLEMMISCAKKNISIWKWFLGNDLLPQKIIFCCFLLKKKSFISVKNHLLQVWKWLTAHENDFEGAQKWFPGNHFCKFWCKFWRLDLLLGKKTFTTEMIISGNGWKSFSSRKCPATSRFSFERRGGRGRRITIWTPLFKFIKGRLVPGDWKIKI